MTGNVYVVGAVEEPLACFGLRVRVEGVEGRKAEDEPSEERILEDS
jgi:hypothetical protein